MNSAWCGRCIPMRSIIIRGSCCCSRARMQFGRPTMGAWAVYGLGSESQESAGLCGACVGRRYQRRRVELLQRISAFGVSGNDVAQFGRSDPVSVESCKVSRESSNARLSMRFAI